MNSLQQSLIHTLRNVVALAHGRKNTFKRKLFRALQEQNRSLQLARRALELPWPFFPPRAAYARCENKFNYWKGLKNDWTQRWKSNPLKDPKRSIQIYHHKFYFLYGNKNFNFKSIYEVVLSVYKEIHLCVVINYQPCKKKGVQNSLNAQLEKRKGTLINPNFIHQGYGQGPICRNETSALV